jgi:hypothetical protein
MRIRLALLPVIGMLWLGACPKPGDKDPCGPDLPCVSGPRDLGQIPGVMQARSLAVSAGQVFVATEDGVFSRPLQGDGPYTRRTEAGLDVLVVRADPLNESLLLAGLGPGPEPPIRVSRDGGDTWETRGQELMDPLLDSHDPVLDIVFAGDIVFASAAAGSIVRTTDDGSSWSYVSGEPGAFGYACYLAVDATTLLQGCELPLDAAWVARIPFEPLSGELGEATMLLDESDLSNRRPNALVTSPHHPGLVWVGVEGGLLWLEGTQWGWIHHAEDGANALPYIYVRGIWVDPSDRRHLLYGGFKNFASLPLFETFDEGETLSRLLPPQGMDPGAVEDAWTIEHLASAGGDGLTAVMAVTLGSAAQGQTTAHVFVRDP